MIRSTAALMAIVATLAAIGSTCEAADLGPDRGPEGVPLDGRGAVVRQARARAQYSYYGEYGYPVPFGYGYAYAPTPGRSMEYGYDGPRYYLFAPDTYHGPAFGYHDW